MNIKKSMALIAFITAVLMAFGFQNSSEHKMLFEKAKFTMETKGDLKGAIKLFEEIIEKYSNERGYAAKSQLYIGLCYEKLGVKEAQKAYQKVIDNYPEQEQEVALAKEKLARIARSIEKVQNKPTFRKIRIPANPGNGVLSADGKKLAFISEKRLWIIPIVGNVEPDLAGEPITLTEQIEAWNMSSTLAWSSDGKWIAFNAEKDDEDLIYIISSEGGGPFKVPFKPNRQGHPYFFRLSLSPDGKTLAFSARDEHEKDFMRGREKYFLGTIPVRGGKINKLSMGYSFQPAFSPDGKKIAYVKGYYFKDGEKLRSTVNVWVMPATGGKSVKISDCPPGSRARGPVWSPDGKMIAFIHEKPDDGNWSKDLWIVPVIEQGKPAAPLAKIELPLMTSHFIAGWTPDNKIGLHLMNPEHNAVYTVPASGGKAVQVSPPCRPENPRWSPDGKKIYFLDEGKVVSVPARGGEMTKIPFGSDKDIFESMPGGGNDISPDGTKIVFSGAKSFIKDNKREWEVDICTISTEGEDLKKITKSPTQDRFPCWSPDGKRVAFIRVHGLSEGKWISNIYAVLAEGGDIHQVTSDEDQVYWSCIDWSPDGKSIAYFSEDKTIKAIPVEGGEPRVIARVDKLYRHYELAWSPDGEKLAYTCKGKIWVVSKEGGTPVEIETGLESKAYKIGWSPDGKKIAFTHWLGGDDELWMMENF
ncbi:MAG: tetratricopeptide repeat protein, partial [Candidatus Aminicenantales bacterium]